MEKENRVVLCLGSNRNKEYNIERAVELLRAYFISINFSEGVYTEAFGSSAGGESYLNRVAIAFTHENEANVKAFLKQTEKTLGRTPEDKLTKSIPIDIDLLQWNNEVLKPKDMTYRFVIEGLQALSFTSE